MVIKGPVYLIILNSALWCSIIKCSLPLTTFFPKADIPLSVSSPPPPPFGDYLAGMLASDWILQLIRENPLVPHRNKPCLTAKLSKSCLPASTGRSWPLELMASSLIPWKAHTGQETPVAYLAETSIIKHSTGKLGGGRNYPLLTQHLSVRGSQPHKPHKVLSQPRKPPNPESCLWSQQPSMSDRGSVKSAPWS